MPAGSAASLPLPQGPLFPSSFARQPRVTPPPVAPGLRPLPRLRPTQKAADDPPRARVLLAWGDTEAALRLQRLLRDMDYAVVGPAGSPEEVERLIMRRAAVGRPVDCALVHVGLADAAAIADRLDEEAVPLVWLVPDCDAVLPQAHAHAPILDRPFDRAALVAAIDEAARRQASRRLYALPPPQAAWPRIFPQL
jgi:hypothetical protein